MLIQEDLCSENLFSISDGVVGKTFDIAFSQNKIFEVYDTIGLCEPSEGETPHKEAIKKIRFYFSKVQKPLHYICYVKKKGRFTKEDKETFNEFKKIFEGGENNFIIIITNSTSEWTRENSNTIRGYFGNHPIIAVDFPFDDNHDAENQRVKRKESQKHLVESLLTRKRNGIVLEVLTATQEKESKVADTIAFVPLIGGLYKLISSGVYYFASNKLKTAKGRCLDGLAGLASDARAFTGGNPFEVPHRIAERLLSRN